MNAAPTLSSEKSEVNLINAHLPSFLRDASHPRPSRGSSRRCSVDAQGDQDRKALEVRLAIGGRMLLEGFSVEASSFFGKFF